MGVVLANGLYRQPTHTTSVPWYLRVGVSSSTTFFCCFLIVEPAWTPESRCGRKLPGEFPAPQQTYARKKQAFIVLSHRDSRINLLPLYSLVILTNAAPTASLPSCHSAWCQVLSMDTVRHGVHPRGGSQRAAYENK